MGRQEKYTSEVRQVLIYAREEAKRLRYRLVNTEHLLLGLLKLNDMVIEGIFISLDTNTESILQALEFVIGHSNKAILSEPSLHPAARTVLAYAAQEAASEATKLVSVEHLLIAILREQNGIAAGVLMSLGITLASVRQVISGVMDQEEVEEDVKGDVHLSVQYQKRFEATPVLNTVSRDMTLAALAGELDPMIGRAAELERTMQILSRRSKNNPILVGPAGVGKTAIVEGLALRIIEGNVPENLLSCRVVSLEVGLLNVGAKFRGDVEERIKMIMQEIISVPNIILFIDEIHMLMNSSGTEGAVGTADLFKPMLARGECRCVGATTQDDYRTIIEGDPALERRFQPVHVEETSFDETLEILQGLRSRYADFHHVTITDQALVAAVQLSSRYIQQRFQPDKALDVLDEAAARICVQHSVMPDTILRLRDEIVLVQREKEHSITHHDFAQASRLLKRERQLQQTLWQAGNDRQADQRRDAIVSVQDIAEIVALQTGIPVQHVAAVEAQQLLNIESELHQRIIGQDEAIQAVAKAVRRARTDIRDSQRPIGSFLFVGPTGVGKTALAHALATNLFGDENALLKLDMSEFMEPQHVSRLIGSPPGYVGHDEAGQLTEAVRRRPYSIVLFDEIEKAHPNVFDLLLQILEDGQLTDAHSQTVSFRHTVIIMTSNAGSASLASDVMGFMPADKDVAERQVRTQEYMRTQVTAALKEIFRPELLNRIDDIVFFHALEVEHLHKIADLMIVQVQQRLSVQAITLEVTEAARAFLVKAGYDPEYGARPLRRTIQRLLEDMLAEALLRMTLSAGDFAVVDVHEGELCMRLVETVESRPVSITRKLSLEAA